VVVTVKLDVIKSGGDAMPAGHSCGLGAAHVRHSGHDHVAEAERFADQDNFKFDGSADRQLPGAEEINTGGTDVASHEGDGRFFRDSASSAKAQGEVQSGARVFPLLGMDADGVRGHSNETARIGWTKERSYS
jgi:hypothetical protein